MVKFVENFFDNLHKNNLLISKNDIELNKKVKGKNTYANCRK